MKKQEICHGFLWQSQIFLEPLKNSQFAQTFAANNQIISLSLDLVYSVHSPPN